MKTCHREVTGLLKKANCILMCWNYLLHTFILVITYISKIDTNNLKYLSKKLATQLVLLCDQRCGEILSLLDIRNLDLSESMCMVRIGDILKTSGPKNHIGEIKFHSYSNDLTLEATKQHGQHYFVIHNSEQTI